MRLENQLQSIQCSGSSFSLDIFEFPSLLYIYDTRPYHQSSLEGYLDYQDVHLSCAWLIRGDIPPQTTLPFIPHSQDSELDLSTTIYLSSDRHALGQGRRPNIQIELLTLQLPFQYLSPSSINLASLTQIATIQLINLTKIIKTFTIVIVFQPKKKKKNYFTTKEPKNHRLLKKLKLNFLQLQ